MVGALPIGGARAVARCDALGEAPYSDEPGQLIRPWLSPGFRATFETVSAWMTDAGMSIHMDPAGNLVGRYEAVEPGAPALLFGSHLDSVRDAGRYDGMLGVILAIELVASFHREGRRFPFALEVIGFGDEEGSRFPVSMITSRAVAGTLGAQRLDLADVDGVPLATALEAFGLSVETLPQAARKPGDILAYVEAHIEQGPVLEAEDHALGVVSGIVAQRRFELRLKGQAGHAGTMAMGLRQDALTAAAEMVLEIERTGRAGPDGLVATVGMMQVGPGVVNVVPGDVAFTLDIRAADSALLERVAEECVARLAAIAEQRGIGFTAELQQSLGAVPCDPALTALMSAAVRHVSHAEPRVLASGAGHDAMVMAALVPVSMLFIRCKGGISHNPAESVMDRDVEQALQALIQFVEYFEQGRKFSSPK